jgi:hypothetical protein
MSQPFPCPFARSALLGSALVFAGCATGQAWVREPEDAFSSATSPELAQLTASERPLSETSAAGPNFEQPVEAPRRRLDHVVSLGEGASGTPAQADGARASPNPTVVVNIVNTTAPGATSYGYGYAGDYGVSATRFAGSHHPTGVSRVAPARVGTSGGTPPVGQDWPAPASHGPSFPYHTGPASPWERTR